MLFARICFMNIPPYLLLVVGLLPWLSKVDDIGDCGLISRASSWPSLGLSIVPESIGDAAMQRIDDAFGVGAALSFCSELGRMHRRQDVDAHRT